MDVWEIQVMLENPVLEVRKVFKVLPAPLAEESLLHNDLEIMVLLVSPVKTVPQVLTVNQVYQVSTVNKVDLVSKVEEAESVLVVTQVPMVSLVKTENLVHAVDL